MTRHPQLGFGQHARVLALALAALATVVILACPGSARAQVSKANQILINRGLQVQGMVTSGDIFHLNNYSNANYTSINWLGTSNPSLQGTAPGFPWARWAMDETQVPPQGSEAPYASQLVTIQLGDEWNLNDDATRTRLVTWFTNVSSSFPNTILYHNNYGSQVGDAQLGDFISRAHPDMLSFDSYPWQSVWDVNVPNHTGAPISGPPTGWYGDRRRYRQWAMGSGIPLATYMQTFHSVQDYDQHVLRDPSLSELRLNHFAALAFNAKVLIDFTYNTGASSLFTNPGGDTYPTPLLAEKTDCAFRARNLGKALVRLKPIADATTQYTTSIVFVRGKNASGTPNPLPNSFVADADAPNDYTDWAFQRNDPYLAGWTVTNKAGVKNGGQIGDVIISWFKPLDESFDGPDHTNEVYLMVVNGLTDPTGTAADCLQEIKLNFIDAFSAVEVLNPLTGDVQIQTLPVVNTRRQLVLDLNGGDAALFKFFDGAPFVGAQVTGAPVIAVQPASRANVVGSTAAFTVAADGAPPLAYQWRKNGRNLANGGNVSGATASSLTLSSVSLADAASYDVIVTGSGSVTSAPPATLSVITNLAGSLVLYEPFDYTNIAGPVSSTTPANWAYGGANPNDLNVTAGSLSYPGLATSIGNSVTNGGAGLGVRRLLGWSTNSGVLYVSALLRINDLGFGAWSGAAAQLGALTAPDNTTFRLQVMIKSNSPSGYLVGVQKGGTGATSTFDTTERHAGDTLFLVGKYDFTVVPNTVALWINPSASAFGSATEPGAGFISANTGTDGFAIDRFNMRQNTAASVPAAIQWDELRVGLSWASVTPLPSPLTVTLLTNLARLANGAFQFAYTNGSGQNGSVYAPTNLTTWAPTGTATQISTGLFRFTDTTATNYPRRFYQLRSP